MLHGPEQDADYIEWEPLWITTDPFFLHSRRALASQVNGLDTIWPAFEVQPEEMDAVLVAPLPNNAFTSLQKLLLVAALTACWNIAKSVVGSKDS